MRRQGILASTMLAAVQPTDPTLAKYRYHRFLYDPALGGADEVYIAMTEMQVFETAGGPDVAPLATPTARDVNSAAEGVANLFDGNVQTYCASGNGARQSQWWVQLDFGNSPRAYHHSIIRGRMQYGGDGPAILYQSPQAWFWQVSNDGQNWSNVQHTRCELGWTSGEVRTYYRSSVLTFFRWGFGKSQGPDTYSGGTLLKPKYQGLDLRPKIQKHYASGYYNRSYAPLYLFDDDDYSTWVTETNGGGNPSAVTVSFLTSDAVQIDAWDFMARHTYQASTPVSQALLAAVGTDDDAAFIPIPKANFTGYQPFGDGELRTFQVGQGT